MFIRTENNYDMREESRKVALNTAVALDGCDGEEKVGSAVTERTKQSFKEEVDINTIVRRFGLTGELPSNVRMPVNGDFSNLPDFQSAMNMLVAAREAFDAMPAEVRSRFHNSPAEFVDFCSDSANRDEAIKLGLVPRPEDPVVAAKVAQDAIEREADRQVQLEAAVARRRPSRGTGGT